MRSFAVVRSIIIGLMFGIGSLSAQTQIKISSMEARDIIHGQYDPAKYSSSNPISDRNDILNQILSQVSVDSLKSYLETLEGFQTRHSASDTSSSIRGIGACRRWIHRKFEDFSQRNESRMQVGYLDFNQSICQVLDHRNVFGVLPGTDTADHELLLIEAHMDSRCRGGCDTACFAPGADDNGSGTALVMELARVMSRLSLKRTVIFTTVTGEEQGLHGGRAWSEYIKDEGLPFMACLNNDVVGGVECGINSSPPSCSPQGAIDSVNVRVFSYSFVKDSFRLSIHKDLGRYLKLQHIQHIQPALIRPSEVQLQIAEDRTGRGGDHIPFRENGFRAIRLTSAHEHGDGAGNAPDRQHTTTDVLGKDKSSPPDGIIDSFYVNFNYLKINTLINGVTLGLLGIAPPAPQPELETASDGAITGVRFTGPDAQYAVHRIGQRTRGSGTLYYDTVYTFKDTNYVSFAQLTSKAPDSYLSFMNVEDGTESLPSEEVMAQYVGVEEIDLVNRPVFEISPNPSNGQFEVHIPNPRSGVQLPPYRIELLSTNGQVVQSWAWSQPRNPITLDAQVASGSYTIRVRPLNGNGTTKQIMIIP